MKHPGTEWGSQWRVVWYNPSRYNIPDMLPTAELCQWCDVVMYDPIPNLPAQKVPTVLLSAAETWCFTCQLFQLSLSGRQGTKHWNSHFSTFEQSFSWDGWRHQTMLQNRGTQTCQEQSWDCTCGRESRAAAIAANVGTSDSLKWAQMLKCRLWIFFETSKLWLKWIGISLSLNKHRLGGKLLAEGMSNQACSSSRFEK